MARILIVEDQAAVAEALCVLFELEGLESRVVGDGGAALAALAEEPIGVVVQDMNFTPGATSGEEGVELFRRIRERHPELPVVLLTAWTSLATAVQLVKEGAADYVSKPWDDDKLAATVGELARLRELELTGQARRDDVPRARAELAQRFDLCGMVYASPAVHRLVILALKVARSQVPVLITGPSGAGKEMLAAILQANSPRREAPFVKVNAGALPEELLEAELFGAEAGAFTGADKRRLGRFEAADGGTLLLDEIGNLSPAGQRKLLRVLQSGELERLGSSTTRRVDVRVLGATNADLRAEIDAGRFREDLYFRLAVVELALPPLARRPEDVLPLAEHLAEQLPPSPAGHRWELSQSAREALVRHPWPGNVRELENALRRAALMASGAVIEAEDLLLGDGAPGLAASAITGGEQGSGAASGGGGTAAPAAAAAEPPLSPEEVAERRAIEGALRAAAGVVARAAEELGLSRQALYRRMDRLGISVERRVQGPGR